MNGGNSDVDLLVYRWRNGKFEETERLRVPGGEDAAFFRISGQPFLATASIRTGSGPYDLNALSTIYGRQSGRWVGFQQIPSFAAKQWHHLQLGGRHFLALAAGADLPGAQPRHPSHSRLFEWGGGRFVEFQRLDGHWGYGWADFALDGEHYLAYADHAGASALYRWNGQSFTVAQSFPGVGGRAFAFFEANGKAWLAFASISGDSILYRWDSGRFTAHQRLGGSGGREFAVIRTASDLYVARICFIEGKPDAPKADLTSQLFRWEGDRLVTACEFQTFGATDAAGFEVDGQVFLAVSNSLSADLRFRQDTVIYRLAR